MTADEILEHCLGLPGAWADEPWGDGQVAKVGSKIFAFPGDGSVGVKCGRTREEADEWLARYPDDASASPYVGRFGWNVLRTDGAIPPDEVFGAIEESYDAVVASLPRRERPTP